MNLRQTKRLLEFELGRRLADTGFASFGEVGHVLVPIGDIVAGCTEAYSPSNSDLVGVGCFLKPLFGPRVNSRSSFVTLSCYLSENEIDNGPMFISLNEFSVVDISEMLAERIVKIGLPWLDVGRSLSDFCLYAENRFSAGNLVRERALYASALVLLERFGEADTAVRHSVAELQEAVTSGSPFEIERDRMVLLGNLLGRDPNDAHQLVKLWVSEGRNQLFGPVHSSVGTIV